MFTDDNTEGFSKEELEKMNAELEEELAGLEPYTPEYNEREKYASERILKKYGGA
jgi:hypothetical protein